MRGRSFQVGNDTAVEIRFRGHMPRHDLCDVNRDANSNGRRVAIPDRVTLRVTCERRRRGSRFHGER